MLENIEFFFIILLFFIIIFFIFYYLFKILKNIFSTENISINLLSKYFNFYKFLKTLEKYQNKFIKQEKKWSNYYIINWILYFILSIISFFIFVLGFFFHFFNLQIYLFITYRFLNYLCNNYYYFFFNSNFFIKLLFIIFLTVYIIFIFKVLIIFFKKIYIYLFIFYKFFTCQGTINIFSIITNGILLNYFDNTIFIKRSLNKKFKKIFKITDVDAEYAIVQSIYAKWQYLYRQSLLLKIIIIFSYIQKSLLKILSYFILICLIYNLYDLSFAELLISIGQIKKEILNSSNILEQLFLIIKFINLKIYLYFYLVCLKIYMHKLFIGIPVFLINFLIYFLPISNSNWLTIKSNKSDISENYFNELYNIYITHKFNISFYQFEEIPHIIILLLSVGIVLIVLCLILKFILKIFFYLLYKNKYNMKNLILNIRAKKLLIYFKYSLYNLLQTYKYNYLIYQNYLPFYSSNFFSNDNKFDKELMSKLLITFIIIFIISKKNIKDYKKLKKIKKIKSIITLMFQYLVKINNNDYLSLSNSHNILLNENFHLTNKNKKK